MSLRRLLAISRRIADGFRRDRPTLGLLFVVPIVITALLGWVLQEQKTADTRALVVNLDGGAAGAGFASAIAAGANGADQSGRLTVTMSQSEDSARAALRNDAADVAIVIPAGFTDDLLGGTAPSLKVITEGANPADDAGHIAALQAAIGRAASSLAPPGASFAFPTVVRETVYGSPDADQLDVFGPVLVGFFAYFLVYILTGISFLRERQGGTLERLLATPVTRAEIVLGYGLGFGFFATIQVAILTTWALLHVDLPAADLPLIGHVSGISLGLGIANAGNPLIAFLIAVVLALGAVNLGIFLSTFARTELQIVQFIPVVIVPQGLLSGIFWPVERLPDLLQPIARALPLTYAVEGVRGVMIKGLGMDSPTIQLDLAVLLGIAAFFVLLAIGTIRREIA
jgi:ABC-2 type transport system permease protein